MTDTNFEELALAILSSKLHDHLATRALAIALRDGDLTRAIERLKMDLVRFHAKDQDPAPEVGYAKTPQPIEATNQEPDTPATDLAKAPAAMRPLVDTREPRKKGRPPKPRNHKD